MPDTAIAPPTPDTSGGSGSTCSAPRTACRSSGGWRTRRSANAKGRSDAPHDKHLIRPGQVIIGDKGFAGREFETFITEELEAHLIRPDRKDEKKRFGKLGGIRRWVESIFDTMKGQLTLEDHGGRTPVGVYSRVVARLLALAAGIWHNWLIGATRKTIPRRLRPIGLTHLDE